jgi:hypothetical protein
LHFSVQERVVQGDEHSGSGGRRAAGQREDGRHSGRGAEEFSSVHFRFLQRAPVVLRIT